MSHVTMIRSGREIRLSSQEIRELARRGMNVVRGPRRQPKSDRLK